MRLLPATLAVTLATAPMAHASAARYQFCWVGANGYTMEGTLTLREGASGIATEADVTDFQIIGFHEGIALGSWTLDQRTPQTSFLLRFNTDTLEFPTGGIRSANTYQEWNANGQVDNCGAVDGFGWNGGNYAQDVCVNNTWVEDSSIDPNTPLFAQPMDVALICEDVVPTS